MFIALESVFRAEGFVYPLDMTFDLSLDVADVIVTGPLHVLGEIRNRNGIVTLQAEIQAKITLLCNRCAKEVVQSVQYPMQHTLVAQLNAEDTGEFLLLESMQLDLEELVREDFILSLPSKFLCKEDCKGICPQCGQDWNEGPCGCKKQIDPRLEALSQLLAQEE